MSVNLLYVWTGGYGPPLTAGRGTPTQAPSPFNAFLVTTPAGGFAAPQGYPQQGYSTAPQFGQSYQLTHSSDYMVSLRLLFSASLVFLCKKCFPLLSAETKHNILNPKKNE